jgi:hypothetical protein
LSISLLLVAVLVKAVSNSRPMVVVALAVI